MAISKNNRARFERIGFGLIRRKLVGGDFIFLGMDKDTRRQAQEWVDEKLMLARSEREINRRRVIVTGIVGIIVAAVAVVAWPIFKNCDLLYLSIVPSIFSALRT
jgi:hypothetical protein